MRLTGLNCPGCGMTRAFIRTAAREHSASIEGQCVVRAGADSSGNLVYLVYFSKAKPPADDFEFFNKKDVGAARRRTDFWPWSETCRGLNGCRLEIAGIFRFCRHAGSCSICCMSLTHPLTTTTFELTGYRVVKSFGVVRGIVVRSRSVIGNFGASIQAIFGGNISLYADLCEQAREEAFNKMLTHAGQLGANALIGVRYDATEIAPGITEVLCYGTAVSVEPVRA